MTHLIFLLEQFLGFLTTMINSPENRPFPWQEESLDSSFTVEFPKSPDMNLVLVGAELHRNPEEHDRLVLHFKGHPDNKKAGLISGDPVRFIFRSKKIKDDAIKTILSFNLSIEQTKEENINKNVF